MVKFSRFSRGLEPNYVWKDGIIGSKAHYVGHHESSDTWMSLFLDLLYVCVFAKLTALFGVCEPTTEIFAYTLSVFAMFFNSRRAIDEYAMRFYHDDVLNRIMYMTYIGFVIVMVMNIDLKKDYATKSSDSGNDHRNLGGGSAAPADGIYPVCTINDTFYLGLAMGFLGTRMLVAIMYSVIMYFDKDRKVKEQFSVFLVSVFISCFFFLVGVWAVKDSSSKTGMLVLVSCSETFFLLLSILNLKLIQWGYLTKKYAIYIFHFPINLYKFQERAAIFYLIVVGEGMLALLLPMWKEEHSNDVAVASLFGFILLFSLTMQYFDRATRHEGEVHAGRRSAIAGVCFQTSHLLLGYFMLIAAQGMVEICNSVRIDDGLHKIRSGAREFLVYGCAGTALMIHYMRTLHDGLYAQFDTFISSVRYVSIFVINSMHFSLLGTKIRPVYQLIAHAMIAFAVVLVDMGVDLILGYLDEQTNDKNKNHSPHDVEMARPGHGDNYHGVRTSIRKSLQGAVAGYGTADHSAAAASPATPAADISMIELTGISGELVDGKLPPEEEEIDELPEGEYSTDGDEPKNDVSNVGIELFASEKGKPVFGPSDEQLLKRLLAKVPREILLESIQDQLK